MRKYEDVDIIASLGAVMELNTEHYQSDFRYDMKMFMEAARHPTEENTHLLWLSRRCGTECFREICVTPNLEATEYDYTGNPHHRRTSAIYERPI